MLLCAAPLGQNDSGLSKDKIHQQLVYKNDIESFVQNYKDINIYEFDQVINDLNSNNGGTQY